MVNVEAHLDHGSMAFEGVDFVDVTVSKGGYSDMFTVKVVDSSDAYLYVDLARGPNEWVDDEVTDAIREHLNLSTQPIVAWHENFSKGPQADRQL